MTPEQSPEQNDILDALGKIIESQKHVVRGLGHAGEGITATATGMEVALLLHSHLAQAVIDLATEMGRPDIAKRVTDALGMASAVLDSNA